MERRLAAILVADIVGYTALMGEDEQKAFEQLKKNRSVQRPNDQRVAGIGKKDRESGEPCEYLCFCARRYDPRHYAGKRTCATGLLQKVNEAANNHNGEDDLYLGARRDFLKDLLLDRVE